MMTMMMMSTYRKDYPWYLEKMDSSPGEQLRNIGLKEDWRGHILLCSFFVFKIVLVVVILVMRREFTGLGWQ